MERVYRGENITTAQKKRKREREKKRAKVFKLKRADAAGRAEFFFFLFFLISFLLSRFVCFRQRVCVCLCVRVFIFRITHKERGRPSLFFPLLCAARFADFMSRGMHASSNQQFPFAALKRFCLASVVVFLGHSTETSECQRME
jgi:hypothetical protein